MNESDLGFTWNRKRKVQTQSPERVILTIEMSSKEVVKNPNRINLEQIVAALCVCVGELCDVVEAQAIEAKAKMSMLKQLGELNGAKEETTKPKPRRTRSKPTDATT